MKVAFLTNIISPYRGPVFQALAATEGWDLRVFVNAETEFDRDWDSSCEGVDVVKARSISFRHKRIMTEPVRFEQITTRFVPTGMRRDLREFGPDLVISVELGPRSFFAARYCDAKDIPFVVWSYQSRSSISSGGRLRRWVRNYILRRAQSVLGMGVQSREILEGYGVEPERIIDAPNSTNNRAMTARLASTEGKENTARLREEVGKGRRIAVIPARLIPLKGVEEMLDMWSALPADVRDSWTLVFVGDGPLAPLVDAKADIGVQRLAPVPATEVADLYAMSDLHIFSSMGDVWGLVVNEAMLCGTPSLCSVHAGCADDLVQEGVNGFLFDPAKRGEEAATLAAILRRDDLDKIGAQALEDGKDYTTDRLADGMRRAAELALQNHGCATALV